MGIVARAQWRTRGFAREVYRMSMNIRVSGTLLVLSNFGRLMNDPRHFDAARAVKDRLDEGHRWFALELGDVTELGSSGVGLLMTITRLVRQNRGEVVVVGPSRAMERIIEEMRLDTYWDVFDSVEEADAYFRRRQT
jgi:anti-sigma B factor antagonist